jgi:hypothetical protein
LLAIWDAKNGTGTGTNINGTPSASGHANVGLNDGYVYDNFVFGIYVALQVL